MIDVDFGIDHRVFTQEKRNQRVLWESGKVINPHMLIMGKSGTGKTYTLRKLLRQLLPQAEGPS